MNEIDHTGNVVNIGIDNLIIDGMDLTRKERQLLQTEVEARLSDLFAQQGIPERISSGASAARVTGEAIHLTGPSVEPISLGKQIATSIYSGLGKE